MVDILKQMSCKMTQCALTRLLVLNLVSEVRRTFDGWDVGHIIYECHTLYKYGCRSCVSSQRVGVTGFMSISDMFQSYILPVLEVHGRLEPCVVIALALSLLALVRRRSTSPTFGRTLTYKIFSFPHTHRYKPPELYERQAHTFGSLKRSRSRSC